MKKSANTQSFWNKYKSVIVSLAIIVTVLFSYQLLFGVANSSQSSRDDAAEIFLQEGVQAEPEVVQETPDVSSPPAPEPEVAVNRERFIVERIIDGDTLDVRDADGNAFRIRLIGIDAPERNENGGAAATNYFAGLAPLGSEIWAEVCPVRPADRFDRERAYLWTCPTSSDDNYFIQARMLQSGNARVFIVTPCCGYHVSRLGR